MNTPRRSARIAAKMGVPTSQSATVVVAKPTQTTVSVPVTLRRSARIAAKRITTIQSKPKQPKSLWESIDKLREQNAIPVCANTIRNYLTWIENAQTTQLKMPIVTNMLRFMCTENARKLLLIAPLLRNAVKNKLVELPNKARNHLMSYDTAINFADSMSCLKKCIEEIEKSPVCRF